MFKIFEQIKEKEQYYREKVGPSYKENDYIFKEVQEFVGHKDITTTLEIYNKLKSRASKEKLGNIMDSLLEYKPT